MEKKTNFILTFFWMIFLFFFLPEKVFAQVVINELLPNPTGDDGSGEWVELYNTSESSLDISGYKLKDADNHELVITADYAEGGTTITGKSWVLIKRNNHTTFSLNNDGSEEVSLWDSAGSPSKIDSFAYLGSLENKSWGRIPDGGSIYSEKLDPSPGSANQIPAATPTLAPVPTEVPPTDTPIPTNTPVPTSYENIYISEFLAYPESGNEWVELYNNNDSEANLSDWYIDDVAGGGSTPISISGTISAKGFKQFYLSSAFLNNDGDDVRLLDGSQAEKDKKSFSSSTKGKTWSKDNGANWCQGEPTPNTANPNCVLAASASVTPATTVSPLPTSSLKVTLVPTLIQIAEEDEVAKIMGDKTQGKQVVLGEQNSATQAAAPLRSKEKFKITAAFLIIGGLVLLGLAGFFLIKEKYGAKNGALTQNSI